MNSKSLLTRTVIVFAALATAGIILIASSQLVAGVRDQTLMVALGSAIFGASLTFFLVRTFSLMEK